MKYQHIKSKFAKILINNILIYNDNHSWDNAQQVDEYETIWDDVLFKNYKTMSKLFDDEEVDYGVAKAIIDHFVKITKEQPFYGLQVIESSVDKNRFEISFLNDRYKQSLIQSVTVVKDGAYLHTMNLTK